MRLVAYLAEASEAQGDQAADYQEGVEVATREVLSRRIDGAYDALGDVLDRNPDLGGAVIRPLAEATSMPLIPRAVLRYFSYTKAADSVAAARVVARIPAAMRRSWFLEVRVPRADNLDVYAWERAAEAGRRHALIGGESGARYAAFSEAVTRSLPTLRRLQEQTETLRREESALRDLERSLEGEDPVRTLVCFVIAETESGVYEVSTSERDLSRRALVIARDGLPVQTIQQLLVREDTPIEMPVGDSPYGPRVERWPVYRAMGREQVAHYRQRRSEHAQKRLVVETARREVAMLEGEWRSLRPTL